MGKERQGMSASADNVDVVVIGGGPSGATAATLLAQYGHRVTLFEREDGPRFHIGESLMAHTYWTFKRLGMLEKLENSEFPRKYSVQFVTSDGKETRPFYFFEYTPHESAVTWQVWRAHFDRLMLDNAREKGCDVQFHAHVTDVLFEGDRAVGVRVRQKGESREVRAKVVVDATGQSSMISSRFKLKEGNPHLRQASVWSYFKDARREPGIDEGATLVLYTRNNHGWFWFIPLPGNVTSIGVVSAMDYLVGDGRKPEEIFWEQVEQCPPMKARLENAKRVKEFRITKDFSYMSKRAAGEGWVLVGDAFGFLDPVYSTGVLLALKSGEFAADAIHEGLVRNDLSAAQLGKWEAIHRRGIESLRKLVYCFYSYQFSFGSFVRQYPQYQRHLIDLLMGDVFKDGVDEIFTVLGAPLPYDGKPPTAAQRPAISVSA